MKYETLIRTFSSITDYYTFSDDVSDTFEDAYEQFCEVLRNRGLSAILSDAESYDECVKEVILSTEGLTRSSLNDSLNRLNSLTVPPYRLKYFEQSMCAFYQKRVPPDVYSAFQRLYSEFEHTTDSHIVPRPQKVRKPTHKKR